VRKSSYLFIVLAIVLGLSAQSFAQTAKDIKQEPNWVETDPPAPEQASPTVVKEMVIDRVTVKDAQIDQVKIRQAEIELARIKKACMQQVNIKQAQVQNLKVRLAEFERAHVEFVQIKQAEVDQLKVRLAEIEQANVRNMQVDYAHVDRMDVDKMRVGSYSGHIKPAGLPCSNPPCGDRNRNLQWSRMSQTTLGEFPLIYGWNGCLKGGPWIQSKVHSKTQEVQIVVTNWDGVKDISVRLDKAYAGASELRQKLASGQLQAHCGKDDCYVCEW
jgi:hypothetical protein